MSRFSTVFLLPALIIVASSASVPQPEAPITLLAQDRLQALVRKQKKLAHGGFKGYYKGKCSSFGMETYYKGYFGGALKHKSANGWFGGKFNGKCDKMGMNGAYTGGYSGKFFAKKQGKLFAGKYYGGFNMVLKGRYEGKPAWAKVYGKMYGGFGKGQFIAKEKAKFVIRVGPKVIKGGYVGSFDGKTFRVAMVGTCQGKKFSIKYEVTLEGILSLIKNEGVYRVTAGGKTFSGKYNSNDMLPML